MHILYVLAQIKMDSLLQKLNHTFTCVGKQFSGYSEIAICRSQEVEYLLILSGYKTSSAPRLLLSDYLFDASYSFNNTQTFTVY